MVRSHPVSRHEPIRWGILSTAHIAERGFLPGLRAAGESLAYAVASRELRHAEEFAAKNGIERAYEDYQRVLDDEDVDAVYIALPNSLHAEWTIKAVQAGKTVLCEKPLTATLAEAEQVLGEAQARAALLWEAFVFLFREQSARLLEVLRSGVIGEAREVQSSLHFPLRDRENIRMAPELGGGSLLDAGCYCVQLARFVFQSDVEGAMAVANWSPAGIDEEMSGVLVFPQARKLLFSCGFNFGPDSPARVLCSAGEIRLTHPFHPGEMDVLEVLDREGKVIDEFRSDGRPTFTDAIHHIHRVLWGEEQARHLAVEDSLGNAVALELLRRSARSGRYESV
jgi:predicted dehydrogenase